MQGKIGLYRANITDPCLPECLVLQYTSVQSRILLPVLDRLSQGKRRCYAWIYLSPCQLAYWYAETQKDSLVGSHCPNKKNWRKPEIYLQLFLYFLYCTQTKSPCGFILCFSPKLPRDFSLDGGFTCSCSSQTHTCQGLCHSCIHKLWQ